ncbi:MAG: helix-turn-helix domain-containing protein, partial [Lachnospiraceae bacterium]|nr:helix-turn-helix domain-containing protein [Lachnospiraceae bacterium]
LLGRDASHLIEGNLYRQKQYDITLLPPSKLHKSIYPEGPAVKRLIIDFRLPKEANDELQEELNLILSAFYADIPIYRFERRIQEELASHMNRIFELLKENTPTSLLMIHSEFIQFLECIYKNRESNIYNPSSDDNLASKIYSVTSYIHIHFSENLTLETLSKEFYISTFYLSHQFKEVTGFNISSYIQMTRIRNAQQMLLETDDKITDISLACGFNSFSQFNRVFNKLCGVSPSKFRADSKTGSESGARIVPMITLK